MKPVMWCPVILAASPDRSEIDMDNFWIMSIKCFSYGTLEQNIFMLVRTFAIFCTDAFLSNIVSANFTANYIHVPCYSVITSFYILYSVRAFIPI